MKVEDAPPRSDQMEGAPHPSEIETLIGHSAEKARFSEALNTAQLHHGWIISGMKGIGKATLAYQLAEEVLSYGSAQSECEGIRRRVRAGSEPRLLTISRPWDSKAKRFKNAITIDEIRKLGHFFSLSSADGGYRAVIIDAADEMNSAAANALLKPLEEPPKDTVIFLISHQPSKLLPTLRSRCQMLTLHPLEVSEISDILNIISPNETFSPLEIAAVSELSERSAGRSFSFLRASAPERYEMLARALSAKGLQAEQMALNLAKISPGEDSGAYADLLLELAERILARAARIAVGVTASITEVFDGEMKVLMDLAPDPQAAQRIAMALPAIGQRFRHGRSVNLDPGTLILDMLDHTREATK